jgi:uncharacterized membrane protein YfhO
MKPSSSKPISNLLIISIACFIVTILYLVSVIHLEKLNTILALIPVFFFVLGIATLGVYYADRRRKKINNSSKESAKF